MTPLTPPHTADAVDADGHGGGGGEAARGGGGGAGPHPEAADDTPFPPAPA